MKIALFYYSNPLNKNFKFWKPCSLEEAKIISNSSKDSGPVGVNCIGCFVWEKIR